MRASQKGNSGRPEPKPEPTQAATVEIPNTLNESQNQKFEAKPNLLNQLEFN